LSPPKSTGPAPFVTFSPNPKCRSSGTLEEYVKAVGPVIRCQPFHLFCAAYALAPPLMDLLQQSALSVSNTGIDMVGKKDWGKTRLLVFSGSEWGGDPQSRRGYAEAWS